VLGVHSTGVTDTTEVPRLELRLRNRLEEIERVIESFNSFAETVGLDTAVRRSLNLVFDEVLNNTISYGYEDDEEHEIEITVTESDGRLRVVIIDDGLPHDPFDAQQPDTELSVEDRPLGGLGVHLVRNLMDQASYERRGSHNVLKLEKQLDSSEESTNADIQ
jgi:anti-sigma regulatory factor (Ser/Thr protein kinase)